MALYSSPLDLVNRQLAARFFPHLSMRPRSTSAFLCFVITSFLWTIGGGVAGAWEGLNRLIGSPSRANELPNLTTLVLAAQQPVACAEYAGWAHEGSLHILTTPNGANLPGDGVVENFPLLVRLDSEWFDFAQAQPKGEDVRFSVGGKPVAYQIDTWDGANGKASVWVRIPVIKGNAQQEFRIHWGRAGALSESRRPVRRSVRER